VTDWMKNKANSFVLLTIFIFSISSCSEINSSSPAIKSHHTGLSLSAGVVTSTDHLTIRYPKHHPSKLAIQGPDHVWYVIHEKGVSTRLMSDEAFRRSTSVTIEIGKLTGVTWINGKQLRQKVFVKPGIYLIYMADNLETEPENTFALMNTVIFKQ